MTIVEDAQPAPPRPWGYVMTLVWTVLSAVLSMAAAFIVVETLYPGRIAASPDLTGDGRLVALLLIVFTAVQIALLAFVARLAGWSAADYFALVRPSGREAMIALVGLAVFLVGYDVLTYLLGRDIVTPFQVDTYRSARAEGSLPLLWLSFVIAAPLGEEIVFRGFLYRGWVRSPRSAWPAIVLISAIWAVMHVQYDWFGILQIFLGGLLLGWIRQRSGSTALTFVLHALANTYATVETVLKVEWLLG